MPRPAQQIAFVIVELVHVKPFHTIAALAGFSSLTLALGLALLTGCGGGARDRKADAPAATPAAPAPAAAPAVVEATDPLARERRPRGLWVLAEGSQRVLDDPAKLPGLIDAAVAMGATDLFVQVYRGGRAWYDASLADPTPYLQALELSGGAVDPLADLLTRAHGAGLRVHAWVNVLSLSTNTQAPILAELGREAVLVDRRGRSVLDYPELEVPLPDRDWYRMGTRGVYLDAGAPGVRERLTATFRELVARYPELDGLHLDYIRQPGALPFVPGSRFGVGLDFGYGAASRARFQAETGLAGPYADPSDPAHSAIIDADAWDDWRRAQVTALVLSIRQATLAEKPGLVISAAVNSYVDRAYLSLAQDWKRWLEEGLIDLAVPMAYTLDDRLLRYQLAHFASAPDHARIWPGIGVWLHATRPAMALEQIDIGRRAGTAGEVLFSYDSIAEAPDLQQALVEAAGRDATAP